MSERINMTRAQQAIIDRVNSDFRFRPCPLGADPVTHRHREAVRSVLGIAALDLVRICPGSRELNHALNKLDEAVYWAHAAINRHSNAWGVEREA
ncbi:MAG: Acb2/Tad1 domain-containing protein [Isosphaeraceae bacterium]